MVAQGFVTGRGRNSASLFKCFICVVILVLSIPILCAQAQDPSPAKRLLDRRMPVWLKAFNVTGVGIAWIENGQISWTAYYGLQVPDGPPANEKTLYSVASLTKPVSAEVILRLASTGKISLDEPIHKYWIDPDVKDNDWNRLLTPRLCLSHQTGFPNWRYQTGNVLKFQWEPGTAFGYSGEGYDYAARFAQNKTGRAWEDLAQQYVFDSIGMKDTAYTPRPWWEGRQAKPAEPASRTQWSAADLLRTTVRDYAKFVVSVMKEEGLTERIADEQLTITRNLTSSEQESVLCEAAKARLHCKVATGFGLGWHIVELNGMKIVDHTGRDADVMTFAFFVPSKQIGAVVFTDGPDVGHQMIDKVLGALYPDPVYAQTLW